MELLRWVPPSTDYMEAGLAKDGSRGGRAGMAGGAAGQGRGPGDAPSRALRVEGSCDLEQDHCGPTPRVGCRLSHPIG